MTGAAWPLLVHLAVAIGLAAGMMAVSHLLGERHRERATGEPYESGIVGTGELRGRLSINFYVVGLLFVIFDLEAAFLFAWAIVAVEAGWAGYAGMLVFLVLLGVGLVYEWRQGALDWGRTRRAIERALAARESSRRPVTLAGVPFERGTPVGTKGRR